jgi:hypothetical protein
MLYKDFEEKVPIGRDVVVVRDLRSYLVAVSFALLLLNEIIPPVLKLVRKFRQPSTYMTLKVVANENPINFWRDSDVTLSTPAGYFRDWNRKKTINLRYKETISSTCEATHDGWEQQQNYAKILMTNRECISPDLNTEQITICFKGESTNFEGTKEIIVLVRPNKSNEGLKGVLPKLTIKQQCSGATHEYVYIATFNITEINNIPNENNIEQAPGSNRTQHIPETDSEPETYKIASFKLIETYSQVLNYALLVDALYTSILNEITRKDECPPGHRWIAHSIFIFVSIAWLIAIILVLPVGFLYGHKYECFGTVTIKDIKQYLIDKFNMHKLVMNDTSNEDFEEQMPILEEGRENKITIDHWKVAEALLTGACAPVSVALGLSNILSPFLGPIVFTALVFFLFLSEVVVLVTLIIIINIATRALLATLLVTVFIVARLLLYGLLAVAFFMGPLLLAVVLITPLLLPVYFCLMQSIAPSVLALALILLLLGVNVSIMVRYPFTTLQLVAGLLVGIIVYAILYLSLRKCKCLLKHLGYKDLVLSDKIASTIIIGPILGIDYCQRKYTQGQRLNWYAILTSANFWLTFTWGLLTALYLPLYLIADNSWPWLCYVGDHKVDDQDKWFYIRIPLLFIISVINIIPQVIARLPLILKGYKWLNRHLRYQWLKDFSRNLCSCRKENRRHGYMRIK